MRDFSDLHFDLAKYLLTKHNIVIQLLQMMQHLKLVINREKASIFQS